MKDIFYGSILNPEIKKIKIRFIILLTIHKKNMLRNLIKKYTITDSSIVNDPIEKYYRSKIGLCYIFFV